MYKVLQSENFVVYDDVLKNEEFSHVWQYVQNEEYAIPHISNWTKVWRVTDGSPLGGRSYEENKMPFNNAMDLVYHYIKETAKLHPELINGWKNLILRSYLYSRDTKLSWHNDQGYLAAAILYTHPYWASTWGGELMIAKTQDLPSVPPPSLEHTFEDTFMSQYGYGQYITAKPNRLVITKGGIWHQINRVDKDAGDHCRSCIVGFFV